MPRTDPGECPEIFPLLTDFDQYYVGKNRKIDVDGSTTMVTVHSVTLNHIMMLDS